MSKPKWIVRSEYTTRKDLEEMYKKEGEDPNEYEIEDFQEIEISVIRKDNKHGRRSYDWNDLTKIILFDDSTFNLEATEKDINWCKEAAKTVCEALNQKGL